MNNGFIYPLVDGLVQFLKFFNLAELFKLIARNSAKGWFVLKKKPLERTCLITASNIGIDAYQIFKWGALFIIWSNGWGNRLSLILIAYLVFSNAFSYFYYHVWGSNFQQVGGRESSRRRFINMLMAILYYLACYACIYHVHYAHFFSWPGGGPDFINAIYLSLEKAFAPSYAYLHSAPFTLRIIMISEVLNTFLFFTVIFSSSVPNPIGNNNELSK